MASNGLVLDDLGLEDDDVEGIVAMCEGVRINEMTAEEVKEKWAAYIVSNFKGDIGNASSAMSTLASAMFVNGAHESLPNTLRVSDVYTWGDIKILVGFKPSMKSMFLRWCAPLMSAMAVKYSNNPRNVMFRLANKWGLEEMYAEIPVVMRFFGGYYLSTEDRAGLQRILAFQKKVIELSSGGKGTK